MFMRRMLMPALAFAIAGLAFSGCTQIRAGKTIAKYDQQTAPASTKVNMAGEYGLFSTYDYTPKLRVNLKSGDTIGFQKMEDGSVVAVAGNEKIPLEGNTTYYWQKL